MSPAKQSDKKGGPPQNAAFGRHEGAALVGGTQYPEMRELERTFKLLNTDESRAAFANRVVKKWVIGLRDDWAILLTALKLVRDHEMYRRPEWVGAASEHPKAYDDFRSYFEDVVREPFDRFVEMEGTERLLLDAGYRLDELLGMKYGEARQIADEIQQTETADREHQRLRPIGLNQHTEGFDNIQTLPSAPTGTSRAATLRRLRKDHPEIHRRVLAGDLSPNAAAIEAGFRRRKIQIDLTVDGVYRALMRLTDQQRDEVWSRVVGSAARAAS